MTSVCVEGISKAFPEADEADVVRIVDHLKEQKPKFTDIVSWKEYVRNYIADQQDKITAEMSEKLSTHYSYLDNVDYIVSYGDIKQALLSKVEEVSDSKAGAGMSIPRIMESKFKIYNSGFMATLESQGVLDAFRSGDFDIDIMDLKMSGKINPDPATAKVVQSISDVMTHYYDSMLADLNESGFNIYKHEGYFGKIVHDGTKIKGNFDDWVSSFVTNFKVKESLNEIENSAHLQEFLNHQGKYSEIPENEYVKALQEDYVKISKDNIFGDEAGESLLTFHGRQDSAARTRAKGRSYEAKDGASLSTYLKQYGQTQDLASMYGAYAMRTSKDIALLRHFGPNYNNGIDMLKNYLKKTMDREQFDSAWRPFEISLNRATGNTPAVPTVGPYRHLGTLRKLTTLAFIGKSGLTQLLDVAPSIIHYHSATGKSFVQSSAEVMINYVQSFPEAIRKNLAEEMYLFTNDKLTSINQELMELAKGKEGMMSKTADVVFNLSGAKFMNKVSYITNAKLYLRRLDEIAKGAPMYPVEEAQFSKFNLNPDDIKHFMPVLNEAGNNMSKFAQLPHERFESNRLNMEPKKYRDLMNERLTAYLSERIQKGSPVAGARERRLMYGDTVENTLHGEVLRGLGQFKVTSAKILIDTMVGLPRESGGYGKMGSYYMLGKWMATTTALGMGVLALKDYVRQPIGDITNGKLPDNWRDGAFTADNFARGALVGGGASIFGDMAYNASDPKKIWQAFETPAISVPLNAIALPFAIGSDYMDHGSVDKKTQDEIWKSAQSVTPLQNWYFVTPVLNGIKAGQINLMK